MTQTPDKVDHQQTFNHQVLTDIRRLLYEHKQSKKWLASQTGLSYDRIKRVFSDNLPIMIDEAQLMLAALGSNLPDFFIAHVIDGLVDDIQTSLKKHRRK